MTHVPEIEYLYNTQHKQVANCCIVYLDGACYFYSYRTCMFKLERSRHLYYITKYSNYRSNTTSKQMNLFFKSRGIPFTAAKYYDSTTNVIAINLCKRDE